MPGITARRARALFLAGLLALAAHGAADDRVTIPRVSHPPVLEDFLDMTPRDTHGMVAVENFRQRFPDDGKPATQRTVAYLGYDAKNLYAVFVCYETDPQKIRAHMTKRDDIFNDDFVLLVLDTFHDRRRSYLFFVNPLGIQGDGLLASGQNDDYSFDTLWYSDGKRTPQGYVVWMAIPFKSLRFPSAPGQTWGIAVGRSMAFRNEQHWWPYVTERVQGILAQLGTAEGLEGISPGRNLQFIPYAFLRSFRALDTVNTPPQFVSERAKAELGVDAKVVLRDKLVLDATVNPDFSQVESDEPQVTVNQRFEVFFPEKRPFFLENSTFFRTPLQLLFTRRVANPQYGARLTGKMGHYALGAFLMDDRSPGKSVPPSDLLFGKRAVFGIMRLNRDLGRESTVGFMGTTREFQGSYNRVLGPDIRLKFRPNWSLDAQAVASETRTTDGQHLAGPAYHLEVNRNGRSFNYNLTYRDISPGFHTDAGFVPRVDIRDASQLVQYSYWPESKKILFYNPRIFVQRVWNHDGVRQDSIVFPQFDLELRRSTGFFIGYKAKRERFQGLDFSKGWWVGEIGFFAFSKVGLRTTVVRGPEINFSPAGSLAPFLGQLTQWQNTLTLRPFNALRIDNTYLLSRLTERQHGGANIFNNHIARMKINYQFTKRLSTRAIFQYDSTLSNPQLTSLQTAKHFTGDFLVTYLVHPGTVLYVGYNGLLENLDPRLLQNDDGSLVRTQRKFIESGKQFFVKFSYLIRF